MKARISFRYATLVVLGALLLVGACSNNSVARPDDEPLPAEAQPADEEASADVLDASDSKPDGARPSPSPKDSGPKEKTVCSIYPHDFEPLGASVVPTCTAVGRPALVSSGVPVDGVYDLTSVTFDGTKNYCSLFATVYEDDTPQKGVLDIFHDIQGRQIFKHTYTSMVGGNMKDWPNVFSYDSNSGAFTAICPGLQTSPPYKALKASATSLEYEHPGSKWGVTVRHVYTKRP